MRVAVLDHGMGNLRSVQKSLEAAGARADVVSEPRTVAAADALCVPGQGVFGRCVAGLRATGLDDVVAEWIAHGRPYLGICLGMQILFETSEERGPVDGLGILRGRVVRLPAGVTVPHIGWNVVDDRDYYYFDHSYAVDPVDPAIVVGWTEHGTRWPALIRSGSILATQFHPEKSGRAGIEVLEGWLSGKEAA